MVLKSPTMQTLIIMGCIASACILFVLFKLLAKYLNKGAAEFELLPCKEIVKLVGYKLQYEFVTNYPTEKGDIINPIEIDVSLEVDLLKISLEYNWDKEQYNVSKVIATNEAGIERNITDIWKESLDKYLLF